MRRFLRILLYSIIFGCLMFVLAQAAMAAELHTSGPNVNFRSGASLDASVIKTLDSGVGVELLDHDPVGWSKVNVDGVAGYIKSEFLTVPAGSDSVVFKTTDGVNFRSAPSLDSEVLRGLSPGFSVEVIEHDPVGWSKVIVNGNVGYIKSEFLSVTGHSASQESSSAQAAGAASSASQGNGGSQGNSASQAGSASSQPTGALKTIDGVNFRSEPSTDSSVIKVLSVNTSVEVLERDSDGWAKVRYDGEVGYIKADYLSVSGRTVELLDWSVVREILPYHTPILVIDVRSGLSYTIKCFSKGDHADVEPATKADTDVILDIRGGVWSWAARPVWVTVGDHLVAASIHAMPHSVSTIPDNGMDGHVCLHFLGSTTSSTSESYKRDLQNAVQEAWNAR